MIPVDLQQLFVESLEADQVIARVLGYYYTRPAEQYELNQRYMELIALTISRRSDRVIISRLLMGIAIDSKSRSLVDFMSKLVTGVFFGSKKRREILSETRTSFEKKNGYYPYIPLEQSACVEGILRVQSLNWNFNQFRFLDVGCGIGDKVALASLMGAKLAGGIEFNKHTFELAKYFLSDLEAELKRVNALKFKGYSDYNLIYLYNPIANPDIELTLLETIFEQLKNNSVILYFGGSRSWRSFTKNHSDYAIEKHSDIIYKYDTQTTL